MGGLRDIRSDAPTPVTMAVAGLAFGLILILAISIPIAIPIAVPIPITVSVRHRGVHPAVTTSLAPATMVPTASRVI
jgi:hypothetical protein